MRSGMVLVDVWVPGTWNLQCHTGCRVTRRGGGVCVPPDFAEQWAEATLFNGGA
jgi:hypothetical protein